MDHLYRETLGEPKLGSSCCPGERGTPELSLRPGCPLFIFVPNPIIELLFIVEKSLPPVSVVFPVHPFYAGLSFTRILFFSTPFELRAKAHAHTSAPHEQYPKVSELPSPQKGKQPHFVSPPTDILTRSVLKEGSQSLLCSHDCQSYGVYLGSWLVPPLLLAVDFPRTNTRNKL